jgi:hypothetical protein
MEDTKLNSCTLICWNSRWKAYALRINHTGECKWVKIKLCGWSLSSTIYNTVLRGAPAASFVSFYLSESRAFRAAGKLHLLAPSFARYLHLKHIFKLVEIKLLAITSSSSSARAARDADKIYKISAPLSTEHANGSMHYLVLVLVYIREERLVLSLCMYILGICAAGTMQCCAEDKTVVSGGGGWRRRCCYNIYICTHRQHGNAPAARRDAALHSNSLLGLCGDSSLLRAANQKRMREMSEFFT